MLKRLWKNLVLAITDTPQTADVVRQPTPTKEQMDAAEARRSNPDVPFVKGKIIDMPDDPVNPKVFDVRVTGKSSVLVLPRTLTDDEVDAALADWNREVNFGRLYQLIDVTTMSSPARYYLIQPKGETF